MINTEPSGPVKGAVVGVLLTATLGFALRVTERQAGQEQAITDMASAIQALTRHDAELTKSVQALLDLQVKRRIP